MKQPGEVQLKREMLALLKYVLPCRSCRLHAKEYALLHNPRHIKTRRGFISNLTRMRGFVTSKSGPHPHSVPLQGTLKPVAAVRKVLGGATTFGPQELFLASIWANVPLENTLTERFFRTVQFTRISAVLLQPGKTETLKAILGLVGSGGSGFSRDRAFDVVIPGILMDWTAGSVYDPSLSSLRHLIEENRAKTCSGT